MFHKRTFILGGSHYLDNPSIDDDLGDFTNEVVHDYLNEDCDGHWKKTFSTFINSIIGGKSTQENRVTFFDSVIFYNFLQEVAGENPQSAANYDYKAKHHFDAFRELLDKHKPEVVICWGSKVWEALPNDWGFGEAIKGDGLTINDELFFSYYDYPYGDQRIRLIGVHHPSVGYDVDYHHQIFKALNVV